MDYEKKYKESLECARYCLTTDMDNSGRWAVKHIFPELKEIDDERIRKELIEHFRWNTQILNDIDNREVIAWLEKQNHDGKKWIYEDVYLKEKEQLIQDGIDEVLENPQKYGLEKQDEQKPIDMVKPKFHEGDLVVDNCGYVWKIEGILNQFYLLEGVEGGESRPTIEWVNKTFHLWTIQDAKDGDVLSYVTDEEDLWIMIYQSLYKPYEGHVHYHALLVNDNFSDKGTCCIYINDLKPATKEQRDFLFEKMHEASYEWDNKKKKLSRVKFKVD